MLAVALVLVTLATGPGHEFVRRRGIAILEKAIDGTVTIGSLGGSLWRAADVRDITLSTHDGQPVIRVARASVRFAAADLIRGRFRFVDVTLDRPVVTLIQYPEGDWNFERLFRLNDTTSGPGRARRPLVEFRSSRIVDGTLIMRQRPERGVDRVVERTVTGLDADMRRFRASHPDSTGFAAILDGLDGLVRNPDIDVRAARGEALMDGDSLKFALYDFRLPESEAQINGAVAFSDSNRTTYGMTMDATRFSFADFRGVIPQLPEDGTGAVLIMARRLRSGATEIEAANASVRAGRSRVSGSAHVVISPRQALAVRGMNLRFAPLDLAALEPYVDTLPVRGLVNGTLSGRGSAASLAVVSDLRFTDERIEPSTVNTIVGRGTLSLGGSDQLVFRSFRVAPADVDARTIAAFAPSVKLAGRLSLAGELEGPWRHALFSGTATHLGAPGEASTLRGEMSIGLGDTVTFDVNAVADSLSLDLLRRTYPGIPVGGIMRGRVRLNGPITGFNVSASLGGVVGGLSALGRVGITDSITWLELEGTFDSLDLNEYRPSAPPTSLAGSWAAVLRVPNQTGALVTGTLRLGLRPGHVAGVPLLAGGLMARLEPHLIAADSLRFVSPGGVITASGSLGRMAGPRGSIGFSLHSDTLAYLEPLVRWYRTRAGDTTEVRLDGAGDLSGRVNGSSADWTAEGTASFGRITVAGAQLANLQARGIVSGGDRRTSLLISASADTASIARLQYTPVGLVVGGRFDSLGVTVSAGFSRASSLHATGSVWGDSVMRVVTLDSVRLDLPVRSWRLAQPAAFAMAEGVMVFDTVELRPLEGSGRILADGVLPRGGVGDFRLAVESLAVADLFAAMARDTSGLGGALHVTAHIAGPSLTPSMEVAAVLEAGRFREYRAPLAQVLARYSDRLLTLKGGLWQDTTRVVNLSGAVPVDLALVPVPRRKLPGAVRITAHSDSADLALFSPFTTLLRDLSGRVSLDVGVSGTWDELLYTGFVDITNGAMTVPALGVRYDEMDVRLDLSRQVINVTRGHIGGGDGAMDLGGSLRLTGAADARDPTRRVQRPTLDLAMRARSFRAFDLRDFGALTATGNLALRGPVFGATLTGSVIVDEGYLRFADLVQKRIVSLDDPEFRAIVDSAFSQRQNIGPAFQQVFMDSMLIDSLGLTMGPDVWLRSNEANIQLSGDFAVHKTIEGDVPRYRLEGTMQTVRGNYRLSFASIVKDFRVVRGTVRFYGTPDFNPDLDIAAEHTLRTYQNQPLTVRAVITGTLLYPRLRLETDQRAPLSETEIVSYLVTGAPLGSGAGLEATVAQSFVLGLAGQVGQSIVSELGLPLDYFTITTGAPTQGVGFGQARESLYHARIGAGAQLGRRTFISLTAGLCEVVAAQRVGASIEYRLRRSLSLNASFEPLVADCGVASALSGLTASYQMSLDLFWQRGLR